MLIFKRFLFYFKLFPQDETHLNAPQGLSDWFVEAVLHVRPQSSAESFCSLAFGA